MALGRPVEYTEDVFDEILENIATRTVGISVICNEEERYPTSRTFFRWLLKSDDLCQRYARAKEIQAELLADQIIMIADNPRKGKKTISGTRMDRNGTPYQFSDTHEGDNVERSKLMVDARKWIAAHLLPLKYGNKLDLTSKGDKLEAPPTRVIFKNPNATSEGDGN